MSRSFRVISAFNSVLVVHCPRIKIRIFFMNFCSTSYLSTFVELSVFGCELALELMACVAFVVSLIEYAISGIWMCMLNYVLNELYVQYSRANCQHLYIVCTDSNIPKFIAGPLQVFRQCLVNFQWHCTNTLLVSLDLVR